MHGDWEAEAAAVLDDEEVILRLGAPLAADGEGADGRLEAARLQLEVEPVGALEEEEDVFSGARNELPVNFPAAVAALGEIDVAVLALWAAVVDVGLKGAADRVGAGALTIAGDQKTGTARSGVLVLGVVDGDGHHSVVHAGQWRSDGAVSTGGVPVVRPLSMEDTVVVGRSHGAGEDGQQQGDKENKS